MGKERTIFIGDVHGCIEELEELLNQASYNASKDRLIYLGDLINKGPNSLEVLKLVKDQNCEILMGNREQHVIEGPESKKSLPYKGWLPFISKFLPYIEDEKFIAVHGGLAPGLTPKETPLRTLTHIRTWGGDHGQLNNPKNDPHWFDLYTNTKPVIFGHYAKLGLIQKNNCTGIDTGCVYGGKLTAYTLPDQSLIQVSAKKVYCPL